MAFVEPPQKMIRLDRDEFFVYTTGGQQGGDGPDDADVCLYSLRKWAGMAAMGNPSAKTVDFSRLSRFLVSGTCVGNSGILPAEQGVQEFSGIFNSSASW